MGKKPVLLCRGFWIFRGQDIPPIMKEECFDLDLYTWTKINPSDEVTTLRNETYHPILCAHCFICRGKAADKA